MVCELLGGVKAPKRRPPTGVSLRKSGEPVVHPLPLHAEARDVAKRPSARTPAIGLPSVKVFSTRRLHPPLRAAWGVGAGASIPPEMPNSCFPRWGLNGVYVARMRDCEGLTCDGELAAATSRSAPTPRTRPTPGVQTHYPMSREVRADVRSPTF